jgi:hypothetical protein
MAASRPVVLVFQEFATLSSTPATPELNCLVAGPGYWIQDFPDDRAAIKWGAANVIDYGFAATAPATGSATQTVAVVRSDAPNNVNGAVLDQSSVKVYTGQSSANKIYVEMAFGLDMTTTISPLPTAVVSSTGTDFAAAGVLPLDTIVITDNSGSTTMVRTVVSVSTNTLTLNSDSTFAATSDAKFRVMRAMPETLVDPSFYTFIPATNSIQVNALATLNVGTSPKRIVSAELYVGYRSLRQDLADVKTLDSVNEIEGQLGRIDARNPLAAGAFVALQNTNTTVQYFGVVTNDLAGFTSMKDSISGRKDIYAVVPLCSGQLATDVLAMLKAEFTALADPDYAVTNGVPQKFRVAVGSSAALPTTKTIIDKNTDGKTEVNTALAVPTTHHTLSIPTGVAFVTAGVLPGDTLTISADTTVPTAAAGTLTLTAQPTNDSTVTIGTKTYTWKTVLSNVNGYVLIGASATTAITNLKDAIMLTGAPGTQYAASTTANGFVTAVLGPPDTLAATAIVLGVAGNSIITADTSSVASWGAPTLVGGTGANRNGNYVVAQVLSETSLELDTELLGGIQVNTGGAILVKVGATNTTRIPLTTVAALDTAVDAELFLDLYDPNGTFVDIGVLANDLVEMPRNPNQDSFTSMDSWKVASIVSNQRLRIVNNGRSNSLIANELPHGASRNAPVTIIPGTTALRYRITRALDKTGQVNSIIQVTQSMASRRVVNVWPDLCDVSGLVDGSLPRDPAAPTTPQPAATQPGYYLACAVGGMTAGLPSHQGFTNMGIAGVSKIYNANTYFSDKQITDISNGGWFVFQQDTPQALPYVVHQLTTDVSTLQSGEYSMVKNFDFVSLFFADILDDYLGIWNVNSETMGFVGSSIQGGIDNLKLRRRPRIGAPLIEGKIVSLKVSSVSADRLEIFVECTFPSPLNTIELHLVSA